MEINRRNNTKQNEEEEENIRENSRGETICRT